MESNFVCFLMFFFLILSAAVTKKKKLKMETLVSDSTIQILDICKLSIIPDSFAGIQSGSIIDVAPANTLKNATTV